MESNYLKAIYSYIKKGIQQYFEGCYNLYVHPDFESRFDVKEVMIYGWNLLLSFYPLSTRSINPSAWAVTLFLAGEPLVNSGVRKIMMYFKH